MEQASIKQAAAAVAQSSVASQAAQVAQEAAQDATAAAQDVAQVASAAAQEAANEVKETVQAHLENCKHLGEQVPTKEVIAEYDTRAPAKMQEFLLQWQQRHDENCVNDMLHVRIRASFLKNFEPIKWSPNG